MHKRGENKDLKTGDTDLAVRLSNLTKIYQLYENPQDRIKEVINPFNKNYHHDFYAINDVSLDIQTGESVAIIGKNGAGKSTLLKMITGVLTPTSGKLEVNGKIASLLELGAGFNPEMTGLENIYLNGTLMGFLKEEMDEKIDAILQFADIGEFINQPVKMYSSGMFARLAFSLSINVDPDILIIDEALSVGDMAFQMKCFKKFQQFQKQGKTILFVTHALDTVIRYCNRGIVIDEGRAVFDDTSKYAVDAFKKVLSGNFYENKRENKIVTEGTKLLKMSFQTNRELDTYGNGKVLIVDYGILDENNLPSSIFEYNGIFKVVIRAKFFETIIEPIFAFTLKDSKGLEITGTNTSMKYVTTGTYTSEQVVTVTFTQKADIRPGKYSLSIGCVSVNENGLEVYNRIYDAIIFDIIGSNQMVGFFDLKSEINVERIS